MVDGGGIYLPVDVQLGLLYFVFCFDIFCFYFQFNAMFWILCTLKILCFWEIIEMYGFELNFNIF